MALGCKRANVNATGCGFDPHCTLKVGEKCETKYLNPRSPLPKPTCVKLKYIKDH